ncbi:MAG: ferritin-like domain-containing protein [Saccharopolyspora sp.]|uniref:ferritin-like domain-containing protein n=1 Tax=Saccharopolyspora sp. TaxID=33915 RepID=UPI0025F137D7|nr:ferritin-like domain-containing protein [Saccharopolyspora sp.]MBQ6643050.1 ferritin-like domain-containing protein [Saccharopolyspora sp.]
MSSELPEQAAQALRTALQAEHAAVWTYGLATAFAEQSAVSSAEQQATELHERHRDDAERLIRAAGSTPAVAAPAYELPQQVTDENSAIRVLTLAEQECAVGWRAVLERTEPDSGDPAVRQLALDALTTAASRATRWRITIGEEPAAKAFPGQP